MVLQSVEVVRRREDREREQVDELRGNDSSKHEEEPVTEDLAQHRPPWERGQRRPDDRGRDGRGERDERERSEEPAPLVGVESRQSVRDGHDLGECEERGGEHERDHAAGPQQRGEARRRDPEQGEAEQEDGGRAQGGGRIYAAPAKDDLREGTIARCAS